MREDLYALFVTTATSEPTVNVRAWQQSMGPAGHVTFDLNAPPVDTEILNKAEAFGPDIIFYTGATDGPGLPSDDTLKALRKIAPSVILQGDMGDPPWFPMLEHYRETGCFDLFASMDGASGPLVDVPGLTPVDMEPYDHPPRKRTFRCGFAGNHVSKDYWSRVRDLHGTEDPRSGVLHRLGDLVQLRERELNGLYVNYAGFLRRCHMVINTSYAGSGLAHHIKGRVVETAFAGAALLEMAESPTRDWFPADSFFTYRDLDEARAIILGTSPDEVAERARRFEAYAREHYTPRHIYGAIVERLGL